MSDQQRADADRYSVVIGHEVDGTPIHMRTTALHAEHAALGATITGFAGWAMPLRYTSDRAEHEAVRTAAGLFDLSHMGELRVRGPGAGRALDRALVGSLSDLAVGRARYTMACWPDGGVADDLIVYRTGDEDFLVVANASNTMTVEGILRERCAGPDVEVVDETPDTALVAVQGPAAADVLAGLVPAQGDRDAVVGLKNYAATTATLDADGRKVEAFVARTGYTGEDGFEVLVANDDAVAVWRALLAAGEPAGVVPAGLAARDSLRLEAGMPLYGNELTKHVTPHDAGLGRVVKLGKTDDAGDPLDFVGRAALAARAEAEPERVLVGLQGLGRRAARQGYDVVRPAGGEAGRDTGAGGQDAGAQAVVGTVTSGAPSPTLGYPVAMAYVTPDAAEPGTELAVDVRGRQEPVRVVPLPFYRRA